MTANLNRRQFIAAAGSTMTAATLAGCGGDNSPPASQFTYGVASGDPLSDRVILWTYAKIPTSNDAVGLRWEVATDANFAAIVASGRTQAPSTSGFTVKVDATGLTAGSSYYYRFIDDAGVVSPVGATRTLPTGTTPVKLAVFSCTLYSAGFFNAYDAAAKSDAQFAIHLGDYIYEYGAKPSQFGNDVATTLGRVALPANDLVSLADYRTRYAQYRSDANLQALHAKLPWITVWDDHEFANNAFVTGAENHDPATQGDWTARKNAAAQAYHEWLPIRTPDPTNLLKIYRRFDFGTLFTLHMIDTRIEGRVQQYAHYGDPIGTPGYQYADYIAGLTPVNGVLPDASRTLISPTQQSWLLGGINASSATWQFIGNQDIMARMWFPMSVIAAQAAAAAAPSATTNAAVSSAINDYLTAKATRAAAGVGALTPAQSALLSTTTNPKLPYNLDSWDGYPANREAVLQTISAANKRLVVLSGDSHNAWFSNLTTLAGQKVGVEFAGSSVTSPGFESVGLGGLAPAIDGSVLVPQLGNAAIAAGLGLIDDVNYAETQHRGFLKLTVTPAAVTGEYVFVDTITSTTYTASTGRTVTVAATGTVSYA
jgi:alkaline phosphatase D